MLKCIFRIKLKVMLKYAYFSKIFKLRFYQNFSMQPYFYFLTQQKIRKEGIHFLSNVSNNDLEILHSHTSKTKLTNTPMMCLFFSKILVTVQVFQNITRNRNEDRWFIPSFSVVSEASELVLEMHELCLGFGFFVILCWVLRLHQSLHFITKFSNGSVFFIFLHNTTQNEKKD